MPRAHLAKGRGWILACSFPGGNSHQTTQALPQLSGGLLQVLRGVTGGLYPDSKVGVLALVEMDPQGPSPVLRFAALTLFLGAE
jgi:hypothetical protein